MHKNIKLQSADVSNRYFFAIVHPKIIKLR